MTEHPDFEDVLEYLRPSVRRKAAEEPSIRDIGGLREEIATDFENFEKEIGSDATAAEYIPTADEFYREELRAINEARNIGTKAEQYGQNPDEVRGALRALVEENEGLYGRYLRFILNRAGIKHQADTLLNRHRVPKRDIPGLTHYILEQDSVYLGLFPRPQK